MMIKLDLAYLESTTGGDPEILKELASIFLQQADEMTLEMEHCLGEKNWDGLSKLAHKAKNSAAIIGLSDLSKELKILEIEAHEGKNESEYPARVENFRSSLEAASLELKRMIPGI
jgi:HPt (histidine-containing phosphotransfer) domain-containing protein